MRKIIVSIAATLLLVWIIFGNNNRKSFSLVGRTMGTTYNIKAWGDVSVDKNTLQKSVDKRLRQINASVSTYIKDSQISKFNRTHATTWIKVSPFFAKMVTLSKRIYRKSDGAFDITVAPLVDIWGFDAKGRVTKRPTDQQISMALKKMGLDKIHVDGKNFMLQKSDPQIRINLSGIAKGGGVDAVAKVLRNFGIKNYVVEIGGEIRTKGRKIDGKPWVIGVEKPTFGARSVQMHLDAHNIAMATSGDYRNYFESNGIRYSHILDPKTGWPISHKVGSVSVLATNTATADGWATAFFVLGVDRGLKIANDLNMAVMFLVRKGDTFVTVKSQRWASLFSSRRQKI